MTCGHLFIEWTDSSKKKRWTRWIQFKRTDHRGRMKAKEARLIAEQECRDGGR
jgi:hypothetical protein